ncbi:MAG TPA: nucleotide disphospho-sugar-binding domain-containing protein [Candidatus Sulfomarinibacteraceae bacterium]|nr:nucleotide disphospho-sugar-binding domain-containing protein [Candidatus Sulfomarinibacteraceae bacterium]
MASILIYTSPARGHLFPILGAALELRSRGHDVHVRTLAPEVDRVRALGLYAEPIAREVEARELDDWRAENPLQALDLAMNTFGDRAVVEVDDVRGALRVTQADALLVDTNSWGAQAVAEASGLPWATFQPYFTAIPAPGVPPFGPGLARATNVIGRLRDGILRRIIFSKMNRAALPPINRTRARLGLDPVASVTEFQLRPPRVFYFTADAFEYPRDHWPDNFRFVGPGTWEPPVEPPRWLVDIERPIALVTCSTERQNDREIVETALRVLPEEGFFVVATSAAYAPEELEAISNAHCRLERFIPHGPVIERASVVICHGGMGITQRALSQGVPVVTVPFGRDQVEVARRVEYTQSGVRLMPGDLDAVTLSAAVKVALSMRDGAERLAEAFASAGGNSAVADGFEELLGASTGAARAEPVLATV